MYLKEIKEIGEKKKEIEDMSERDRIIMLSDINDTRIISKDE